MNLETMIAIHQNKVVENTTMVADISTIHNHPVFFTYPELTFNVHFSDHEVRTISLPYHKTFADLREEIAVGNDFHYHSII